MTIRKDRQTYLRFYPIPMPEDAMPNPPCPECGGTFENQRAPHYYSCKACQNCGLTIWFDHDGKTANQI